MASHCTYDCDDLNCWVDVGWAAAAPPERGEEADGEEACCCIAAATIGPFGRRSRELRYIWSTRRGRYSCCSFCVNQSATTALLLLLAAVVGAEG